jgi:hypothetical protein
MTQGKKYWVLGVAMLVAGAVRMPFEQQLTTDFKKEKLLSPKLEIGTGEKLGQTFYAVSLGGLRTLIATFLNLRAFGQFEDQKWADVADTYDLIVDLAPRTRYYWDAGAWHLSNNASSHYINDSKLPSLRRKILWKSYIQAGRTFLERGIKNNPEHPLLYERLGHLLADPYRIQAFGDPVEAYTASYDAFMAALDTGGARSYSKRAALYSLARVPGREKEALDLLLEIKAESKSLPPSALTLHYVLEFKRNPDRPVLELVDEVFPSRRVSYTIFSRIWLRNRERFPMDGVAKAIGLLELEFGIPEEKSILKQTLPPGIDSEEYFR